MILTNARILTLDQRNTILDNGSVEVRADGTMWALETASITTTGHVVRAVAGQTGTHIVAS